MNTMLLYPKLAVNGIKKNRRIYLPYILTCAGMIMMYYITSFLTVSSFVKEMQGGTTMQMLLYMGCGVMVVFSDFTIFSEWISVTSREYFYGKPLSYIYPRSLWE